MPRELTAGEQQTFKAAHPDIDYNRIPEHGLAVQDGSRYVLVWLDAINRWHFIDLTGATQFNELIQNKPAFASPGGSLVDALWEQLGKVGGQAQTAVQVLLIVLGVVVVLFFVSELKSVSSS